MFSTFENKENLFVVFAKNKQIKKISSFGNMQHIKEILIMEYEVLPNALVTFSSTPMHHNLGEVGSHILLWTTMPHLYMFRRIHFSLCEGIGFESHWQRMFALNKLVHPLQYYIFELAFSTFINLTILTHTSLLLNLVF